MANNITINISAGTAKFNRQLDDARRKLQQTFGHGSVSGVQATSASLRLLEGNLSNNVRAVERFLANTLKLGPVLQAAFPIVGAAALVGYIAEATQRIGEFFKEVTNAPEKARGEFADLNQALAITNDSLSVSGARLENEIATLSGHPTNNLKVALLEAKEAADKLNESLGKDIASSYKLLDEQSGSMVKRLGSRLLGNADVKDIAKELGGAQGQGGFREKIRGLSGADLEAAYKAEIEKFQQMLSDAQERQLAQQAMPTLTGKLLVGDQTGRLEDLKGILFDLQQALATVQKTAHNTDLSKKVAGLQDKNQREQLELPAEKALAELRAQLDAVHAKLSAIGGDPGMDTVAAGAAKAFEKISALNEELKRRHEVMSVATYMDILTTSVLISQAEAEEKYKKKLDDTNSTLDERIKQQRQLNTLAASDYVDRRNIATENKLKGLFGADYSDPRRTEDIAGVRGKLNEEADLEHNHQLKLVTEELTSQIGLYSRLAQVAGNFALTHQAELDAEVAKLRAEGKYTEDQIRQFIRLDELKQRSASATRAAADVLSTQGSQRITGAAFGGQDAVRRAQIENAVAEARAKGAQSAEIAALQARLEAEYQEKIVTDAAKLATARHDQMETLDREIAAIREQMALRGADLDLQIALKDLEDQRLRLAVQYQLAQDNALAGVRAFFLEMQTQAEKVSQIIYNTLNSAVSRVSDNLAKMMTERAPKGGWGKVWGTEFKELGQSTLSATIHSGLQRGLGALGKRFGITIPGTEGKLGTAGNPIHAIVDNLQSGLGPAGGTGIPGLGGSDNSIGADEMGMPQDAAANAGAIPGILSGMGKIFSGGTGVIMNLLGAVPGFADGGDPGGLAVVGERGPELAYFGGGGHVMSNRDFTATMQAFGSGGGGDTYIDARGSDIGVEHRIQSAMEAAHQAAVSHSVQTEAERRARTPQRSGK